MKTKGRIIDVVLSSILMVAFNVLFFLLVGTDNPVSVWLSYGFVHLAWVVLLCTPALFNSGDHPALRAALYSQTIAYFLVALVAGCVFIYLRMEAVGWPLVVQVAIFVLFMIVILGNARANISTAQQEAVRVADRQQRSDNAMRIKMLSLRVADATARERLTDCYDRLMRSTAKNHPAVEQKNAEIAAVVATLEGAATDADTLGRCLDELAVLISQREEILKFNH